MPDLRNPVEADLPTSEQVAQYQERGWFISDEIVPHALLDEVAELLVRHQMRPPDERMRSDVEIEDWAPGDDEAVKNSEYLTLQQPTFAELTLAPLIGAIAARLALAESIRIFDDQAVVKAPGAGETVFGWHTDSAYWSTCTSGEMLTAWIPLHDTTLEGGTLVVVEGSHHWDIHGNLRLGRESNMDRISTIAERDVPPELIVPLELKKGQVSFHHMDLLHASGANRSTIPRQAIAVHLQPGDNEYRFAIADDGSGVPVVLANDNLCQRLPDGRPDYADPRTFPVLWPRTP